MRTPLPTGPDPETIVNWIHETYPEADAFEMDGTWFFSFDPETHWPAFATLTTSAAYDSFSDLSRPGVFRLNLGVDRATFERLVGDETAPDHAALDRILPHPEYGRQHWICVLNPSTQAFDTVVIPLLTLAHDRLAEVRARHAQQAPNVS